MANTHETLTGLFTDIAGAIRAKTGGTGAIVADNFPEAISSISVGVDTSDATASAGEILSGETAYVNGAKVTGSMANNGAVSQAINAGGSYTIPAGYHDGSGKVTGNSLASQTSADAAAGDIASGKTAWVNGAKVTGTLIPAIFESGFVKVAGASINPPSNRGQTARGSFSISGIGSGTHVVVINNNGPSSHVSIIQNGVETNFQSDFKDGYGGVTLSASGNTLSYANKSFASYSVTVFAVKVLA